MVFGLGVVYRYFVPVREDPLAAPKPLGDRPFMERKIDQDASVGLVKAKEVLDETKTQLTTCDEQIRVEKDRHQKVIEAEKKAHDHTMGLLSKKRKACVANLDKADEHVKDADEEFRIANDLLHALTKRRKQIAGASGGEGGANTQPLVTLGGEDSVPASGNGSA